MKNRYWILFGLVIFGIYGYLEAQPRSNPQTLMTAEDDGDSLFGFSVQVGTGNSQALVFSSSTYPAARTTYPSSVRIIGIQNIQAFDLYCGTYPTISATTGPRWLVYNSTTASTIGSSKWMSYSIPSKIYCVFSGAAGAGTKEVIGWVGYDSGD